MPRGETERKKFHFRDPKTHAEIRENSFAISEGIHVRGKRSPRMLPDAWDDIQVVVKKSKPKGSRKADKRRGIGDA